MNYESCRRLWKMFFPHLTEHCGVALVRELIEITQRKAAK